MGFTQQIPPEFKDRDSRDAVLEPMRLGLEAERVKIERARTLIFILVQLRAESRALDAEHQALGLPPIPPLIGHSVFVEARNMVLALLFPDKEHSFLAGYLETYMVNEGE